MVAVVCTNNFGGGWASANDDEHREFLCMDKSIAEAVLRNDEDEVRRIVDAHIEDAYLASSGDLGVTWVPKGAQFEIEEYDGRETVHVIGHRKYMTA